MACHAFRIVNKTILSKFVLKFIAYELGPGIYYSKSKRI
ncbi:hypothetical protein BN1088_1430402 [Sphingobacterium sp. PM2-P1-29]|nr:hypothetical protein BN1088_1430402 [Sphingobacterium sp. PM2-P1-29]